MRKIIITVFLSSVTLLVASLVSIKCAEAEDCAQSNVQQLQALSNFMKPKYETVALDPERPWVQVSKSEKDFYNWHGRLPAEGEVNRGQ